MPELVSLTDAAAIVKKPRLSAAIYAFKRTAWKAPSNPTRLQRLRPASIRGQLSLKSKVGLYIKKNMFTPCTQLMVICFFFLK